MICDVRLAGIVRHHCLTLLLMMLSSPKTKFPPTSNACAGRDVTSAAVPVRAAPPMEAHSFKKARLLDDDMRASAEPTRSDKTTMIFISSSSRSLQWIYVNSVN
mmetsp:Transcript_40598/g.60202  ORF Transcript_40598/g.60202 Transcript_40598/m.60202 type:complete len:104 (-) Transcript_40598:141-452(-)